MNEKFLYSLTPAGRLVLSFNEEGQSFEDTKQHLLEIGYLTMKKDGLHITEEGRKALKNIINSNSISNS